MSSNLANNRFRRKNLRINKDTFRTTNNIAIVYNAVQILGENSFHTLVRGSNKEKNRSPDIFTSTIALWGGTKSQVADIPTLTAFSLSLLFHSSYTSVQENAKIVEHLDPGSRLLKGNLT